MEELQQKIAQAMQSDFVGDVVFDDEEIEQMKADCRKFYRAAQQSWSKVYRSEDINELIVLIINIAKTWDDDKESRFWVKLFGEIFDDASISPIKFYNEFENSLKHHGKTLFLSKENKRMFREVFLLHAFAPDKSRDSFVRLLWNWYTDTDVVGYDFQPNDPLYTEIANFLDKKFSGEVNMDILKHCKMLCAVWFADKILLPEKLEKDYDDSVKFFQEKLAGTYSEKQISAILKTNKPFLCEPYTNFRKIVGENLGDDYAKLYGLYSQAIHPSVNDFYMNEGIWDTLTGVLLLVMEEYKSLPQSKLTFNSYYNSIYTSDIAKNYEDIVRQECKILVNIGDVFCKSFNKNYTSDTLASTSLLMGEMCTDKLLGLCEQVKSKWKIVLELCASFYECYITPSLHEERFMLLEEHEHLQTQRNLGESCSVNQAYSIYKTLYPNGVNIDLFEKNFLTTCGYTIDEKGVAKSLTGIVKEFIKKFTTAKAPISLDRAMLLDYIESQMISHANGYMWYANSGSWGDVNNVIIGADICVIFLLESILTVFKIHRAIDESNQYKQIINIVRNSIKRIRALSEEKAKILKIPGIII